MVMFLTSTPEKVLERRQLAVPIAEPRLYNFTKMPTGTRINATFAGAFLPSESKVDHSQRKLEFTPRKTKVEKEKENYIRVYLQTHKTKQALTIPKLFAVVEPKFFDTTNTTKIPIMFDIGEEGLEILEETEEILQLVIQSNFTKTEEEKKQEMPLQFVYDNAPINKQIGVIFAAFVLIFLYALIIWEVRLTFD
jgi:P protein